MCDEKGPFLSYVMGLGLLVGMTASLFIVMWFLQQGSSERLKAQKTQGIA